MRSDQRKVFRLTGTIWVMRLFETGGLISPENLTFPLALHDLTFCQWSNNLTTCARRLARRF